MAKKFDLKEKMRNFHTERADFKKLVETPGGVRLIISEIKKNKIEILTDSSIVDYLNSMCQVSVSFVALKNALKREPGLLRILREYGFRYVK